jgi:hypothetical protein
MRVRGTAGIIALASAVLVGTLVVVFVQFQDGGKRGGMRVGGVGKAEAACSEQAPRCLPKITMMDLTGREWRPDELAGKVVVVNVWATWCKPCVEELPKLRSWTARLTRAGSPIELVLLSVDESRDAIAGFETEHGKVGDTARVTDPEAIKPWLVSLGLDEQAPLPVHILVAPDGAVRCLRASAVNDLDYDKVAAVLDAGSR